MRKRFIPKHGGKGTALAYVTLCSNQWASPPSTSMGSRLVAFVLSGGHAWRPRATVGVRFNDSARPAHSSAVVQVCRVFFEALGWGGLRLRLTANNDRKSELFTNLQSAV